MQIILGHLGENLPFGLDRLEVHTALSCKQRGLKKMLKQYFRDGVWITTSGNFAFAPSRRLAAEVGKILREQEVQKLIRRNGEQPFLIEGKDFSDFVDRSLRSWGRIINRLGVKMDE